MQTQIHKEVGSSILKIQYSSEHKILLRNIAVGMEYIFDMLFQLTCK